MFETIVYGLTTGAILYFFAIGLSITFGTMHIINYSHPLVFTLGVYLFLTFLPIINSFILALLLASVCMIPISYLLEKLIIRKLYGESLDYAIIATYALLYIGTDVIKFIWGNVPRPVSDPIGSMVRIFNISLSTYRIIISLSAIIVFFCLRIFFKKTIIGKIVIAALEDEEGVRCLGIRVNKYFSIMFIIGSVLAVIGGVLYAPISAADPYMGTNMLLLAFAVVMIGGLGSLNGTFYSAIIVGLIMALTGRFWPKTAEVVAFIVMAGVLLYRRFRYGKMQ